MNAEWAIGFLAAALAVVSGACAAALVFAVRALNPDARRSYVRDMISLSLDCYDRGWNRCEDRDGIAAELKRAAPQKPPEYYDPGLYAPPAETDEEIVTIGDNR